MEEFDDISIEDLAEGMNTIDICSNLHIKPIELPDNAPRFVLLSYEQKFDDGRISFPLVLIDWIPTGSETGAMTLHAGAYPEFQAHVSLDSHI